MTVGARLLRLGVRGASVEACLVLDSEAVGPHLLTELLLRMEGLLRPG